MVKKHFLFLFFQIKSAFSILPRLIICSVIFGAIAVSVAFCGNQILNKDSKSPVKIVVAAVLPENDPDVKTGFQIVSNMESLSSICSFISTDKDTALKMLSDNEISAIIEIPPGFVDDLMYGRNTPATIILPENSGFDNLVIKSVIDAGAQSLSASEAGIYAVLDFLEDRDYNEEAVTADKVLFEYYLKYTFNRGSFFKHEMVSATGNSTLTGFYLASGTVFIMLLCGMAATGYFSNRPAAVTDSLKISGISKGYMRLSEYAGITLMFFILFGIIIGVCTFTPLSGFISMNLTGILSFLVLTCSVISFIMFLCCLADSGFVSNLLIFLLSSVMLFAGGRIIPGAYLPVLLERIGMYFPAYSWCNLAESMFLGIFNSKALCSSLFFGVIFFAGSILITLIKGNEH